MIRRAALAALLLPALAAGAATDAGAGIDAGPAAGPPAGDCPPGTPPPFTARYRASILGGLATVGEYRVSLSRTGPDRFRYRALSRSTGLLAWFRRERILERSDWTLLGDRIQPLDSLYERTRDGRTRRVRTRFDWSVMRAVQYRHGGETVLPLRNGTLDRILFQLALMRDLRTGRRPLTYRFIDSGRVKTFRFTVAGGARVVTPLGTFDTVRLERVPLPGERADYVWAAPRLCYLAVRITYRRAHRPALDLLLDALTGGIALPGRGRGPEADHGRRASARR